MRKTKLFFLILFIISLYITGCKKDNDNNNDPELTFHLPEAWNNKYTNYSMNLPGIGNCFVNTNDGGAAIFFSWYTETESGTCLLKTDANGSTVLEKTYPATAFGCGYSSLIQTSDNGFLLIGETSIGKTDISGNLIWTKEMDYHSIMWAAGPVEKPDGGFLVLARNINQLLLVDLDELGDTLECNVLRDSLYLPDGIQISYNTAGELIIAYMDKINDEWAGHLMVLDSNKNELWSVEFINPGHHTGVNAFYVNPDNSIMVVGYVYTVSNYTDVALVSKINPSGTVIWQKSLTNLPSRVLDIEPSSTGGYLLCMDDTKQIAKINDAGDFLWNEKLDKNNALGPLEGLIKKQSNSYYFFGHVTNLTTFNENPVLIKFSEQ